MLSQEVSAPLRTLPGTLRRTDTLPDTARDTVRNTARQTARHTARELPEKLQTELQQGGDRCGCQPVAVSVRAGKNLTSGGSFMGRGSCLPVTALSPHEASPPHLHLAFSSHSSRCADHPSLAQLVSLGPGGFGCPSSHISDSQGLSYHLAWLLLTLSHSPIFNYSSGLEG